MKSTTIQRRNECKMLLKTSANHLVFSLIKLFHALLSDIIKALEFTTESTPTAAQVYFFERFCLFKTLFVFKSKLFDISTFVFQLLASALNEMISFFCLK